MFNIFKAVGSKIMGDLKNKALKLVKDAADEIIAMAKTQDLDANDIKDHVQLKQDLVEIGGHLQGACILSKQSLDKVWLAAPYFKDIIKLAGLYYLQYGPKRPSTVVAALEAKSDVA